MMLLPWRSAPGTRTMPSSLPTWLNAHPIRWRFTAASPAAFPFDRAMPVNTIFSAMTCSCKVSAPRFASVVTDIALAVGPRAHAPADHIENVGARIGLLEEGRGTRHL